MMESENIIEANESIIAKPGKVPVAFWSFDDKKLHFLLNELSPDERVEVFEFKNLSDLIPLIQNTPRVIVLLCVKSQNEQDGLVRIIQKTFKTKKPGTHHIIAVMAVNQNSFVFHNEESPETYGDSLQVTSRASLLKFVISQISLLCIESQTSSSQEYQQATSSEPIAVHQTREFVESKAFALNGKTYALPRIEKVPLGQAQTQSLTADEKEHLAIATCQITKDGNKKDVTTQLADYLKRTWSVQVAFIFKQRLTQYQFKRFDSNSEKQFSIEEKKFFPPLKQGTLEVVQQKELFPELSVDTKVHYTWSEASEYCAFIWYTQSASTGSGTPPISMAFLNTLIQVILKLKQWSQPQSEVA